MVYRIRIYREFSTEQEALDFQVWITDQVDSLTDVALDKVNTGENPNPAPGYGWQIVKETGGIH